MGEKMKNYSIWNEEQTEILPKISEEQKLAIMKMLKEQRENPELEVTEKITRYKRVNARKYAY